MPGIISAIHSRGHSLGVKAAPTILPAAAAAVVEEAAAVEAVAEEAAAAEADIVSRGRK